MKATPAPTYARELIDDALSEMDFAARLEQWVRIMKHANLDLAAVDRMDRAAAKLQSFLNSRRDILKHFTPSNTL